MAEGEEEAGKPVSTGEEDKGNGVGLGFVLTLPGLLPSSAETSSPPNLILSFCLGFVRSPGDGEGLIGACPGKGGPASAASWGVASADA